MRQRDETELAKRFGAHMPIGTRCRYYPILPCGEDEFMETEIASEPWLLGHGAAVVKVEGKTGGVLIRHVFPIGIEPKH